MEIRFLIFLIFLSGDCETWQPHHDTHSQKLEWGLHSDINSIFRDFSWHFEEFQNFLTHSMWKFTDFSWLFKIFTFSWPFPDLWEPCYWRHVVAYICVNIGSGKGSLPDGHRVITWTNVDLLSKCSVASI